MQANAITDSPNGQDDNDDVLAGAKLENPYTGHAADCSCRECAFEGAPVEELSEAELGYRRDLPPVRLHRLPDWLAEDDLPDGWQIPRLHCSPRKNGHQSAEPYIVSAWILTTCRPTGG